MATKTRKPIHNHRQRTTLPLDRALLADAQRELGTKTITETVESALRLAARRKPRALFNSDDPDWARGADLDGFGDQ